MTAANFRTSTYSGSPKEMLSKRKVRRDTTAARNNYPVVRTGSLREKGILIPPTNTFTSALESVSLEEGARDVTPSEKTSVTACPRCFVL